MRVIVNTRNDQYLRSIEITEDDLSKDGFDQLIKVAESAGNGDMTGSFSLRLASNPNQVAIISIHNIDHVIFEDPLYQDD